MDIFERVKKQRGNIGQYAKEAHGYFAFPKLEGEIGPRMMFRGKEVLNWSLNNYIGLANDPEVRKVDAEAAAQWGLAYPMGARMMSGQTSRHEYLESQLADFVGKPDAFLLNFGYQGMISIIDSLTSRFDCIVYDAESHACIMDGLRLSPAKRYVYVHNDMSSLRKQLEHATKYVATTGGGILVVTEGVFGMAGDLGKLDEITALKSEFNFRLLVDDAHGFGTMGPTGAGTGEHFGVQDKVDLYFGTFAKAMAGFGAFVATDEDVCMSLRYTMRSQMFAKSLTMPMVEGAIKRLEMLKSQPEAVDDVKKLQAPAYQADLTAIQRSFMSAVQAVKKEVGNDLSATRELTSQAVKKIYVELTKGQKKPNRKITAEQIGEAVAQSVSHLPGIDTEVVKQMFLAMTGTVQNHEKRPDNQ